MMNTTSRLLMLCALVGASACNLGTRPKDFPAATGPAGARIAVRVSGQKDDIVGEMYAVDSIGVTVFDGILRRISWGRLAAMDIKDVGDEFDLQFGEQVTAEKRTRIARLARFPQGLNNTILRAVSARTGQATLEEIR
jgi:hypothetical protein